MFVIISVDDSGVWGSGGIFSALSAKSDEPDTHYTLAGQMKGVSDFSVTFQLLSPTIPLCVRV